MKRGSTSAPKSCRTAPHRMAALLVVLLVSAGCGGTESGFEPVVGMVTFDGSTLSRGTVTLRPVGENSTAHHPTGVIGSDGRYTIYTAGEAGAPVGRYNVLVFANEEPARADGVHPVLPRSILPDRYRDEDATPLAIEVVRSPPPGAYDLALETPVAGE